MNAYTKTLLTLSLVLTAASPAFAQVFDDAGKLDDKKVMEALASIDKRTLDKADVFSIVAPFGLKKIDRKWESGPGEFASAIKEDYGLATADERVRFAHDYEAWLRSNGESVSNNRLVPYKHRIAFASQWWTRHAVGRFQTSNTTEWARQSLIDAGYLIATAAKDLQLEGKQAAKNDQELSAVYSKQDQTYPSELTANDAGQAQLPLSERLQNVDKASLAASYRSGAKTIQRVWTSGYGGVSAADREKFVTAYNVWTADPANKPKLGNFHNRMDWAASWWTDNCPEYRAQHYNGDLTVDPWRSWARDSVADADLLTCLAHEQNLTQLDLEVPFQSADFASADAAKNDTKVPSLFAGLNWFWNEKAQVVTPGFLSFPGSPIGVWNAVFESKLLRGLCLLFFVIALPVILLLKIAEPKQSQAKAPTKPVKELVKQ